MTFFLILVLLGYLARMGGWLPPLFAAPAGVLGAFLLPGPALVLAAGAPRSRVRDWIIGPALSPILLGGVAALAYLRHQDPSVWVHAAVLSTGFGLVVMRWTEGRAEKEETIGRGAWLVGLGLASVVAALLVANPWLRQGSDAWFHTAVAAEIQRVGIPPDDPYFAGMPLQYFWFFHVVLIALQITTGMTPPDAMAFLNIVAAVGCVVMAARIGIALGFTPASGAWGGALLLLGMGGLSGLFLPIKILPVFLGEVRGMDEAARMLPWTPFTIPHVSETLQVLFSRTFMLRKFLTGTAVPYSILLALIAWEAGVRLVREGHPRFAAVQLVAGAGAILMHVVVGGALMAALAFGGGVTVLFARGARWRGFFVAALVAGSLAVCLRYLIATIRPGERSGEGILGFEPLHVLSLPVSLLGVALLSILAIRSLRRSGEPAATLFLGTAAACLAYGIFGRLPDSNQYDKLTTVAFVPLALAGGLGVPLVWERLRGSRRLRAAFIVGMGLFLIPENAIMLAVFAVDSKAPVVSAEERAMFEWIGEETPPDAVFIDSADRSDVLVRGPRRQYWGIPSYAKQWGYPVDEMARRRALRDDVYEGSLTLDQLDALRALHAPVYVLARENDFPGIGNRLRAQRDLYRPVFAAGTVRVFEIRIPGGARS